jgi:hypothetical protein
MQEFFPKNSDKFFELFNRWFDEQMYIFEKNVENVSKESSKGIQVDESYYPGMKEYQKFVAEHIDLWIKNYRKMIESREQYDNASLEFLKSIFPDTMHPMLENANKWKREQTERLEADVLSKLDQQKKEKVEPEKSLRLKKKIRKK